LQMALQAGGNKQKKNSLSSYFSNHGCNEELKEFVIRKQHSVCLSLFATHINVFLEFFEFRAFIFSKILKSKLFSRAETCISESQ
jgi:hypothetical protein